MFLRVRDEAMRAITANIKEIAPGLTDAQATQLTTFALAGADGLFIAKEIGGDDVDLPAMFDILGQALYSTAVGMLDENERR